MEHGIVRQHPPPIWALLAASWDLLSGYTGQISFGHAGFFALGAYAAAASTKHADVSPWLGLLVGATIAATVGFLTGSPPSGCAATIWPS